VVSATEIRLLVLDVDGVLTDGTIAIGEDRGQYRRFHIRDGLGVRMWQASGRKVAILTSKKSEAVMERADMLGIELIERGAEDKLPGFERILSATGISREATAYVGDDLLDAVILRRVGYPMAVADAVDEIKKLARFVSSRPGGHGAVRECIEHLLKQSSAWEAAIKAIGADR
jgi:3-deoxy-D-manno-octulosonate 8-phosphate phosphatase (KDO 8-P phosphatase)